MTDRNAESVCAICDDRSDDLILWECVMACPSCVAEMERMFLDLLYASAQIDRSED